MVNTYVVTVLWSHVYMCSCATYMQSQGGPSTLLYGDENGDVHILTFANACLHLFVVENRKSRGVTPRISYNVSDSSGDYPTFSKIAWSKQ